MQHSNTAGCILLKFYIKPQHTANVYNLLYVVSYRNSTSNHNSLTTRYDSKGVVSYRNSTSNHNSYVGSAVANYVVSYRNSTSNHNIRARMTATSHVVSYRNSTSNHNSRAGGKPGKMLYLIEILHQTTTWCRTSATSDWLYLIEILHQTTTVESCVVSV